MKDFVHHLMARLRVLGIVLPLAFGAGLAGATEVLPPDDPPPDGGGSCANICPGILPTDDVVDVRSCQAAGDGSDETTKLQCAADLAAGRTLWIPAGRTFGVEGPEGIRIYSRTQVKGGGTLKYVDGAGGFRLLEIRDAYDVSVSDLTFDGNVAGQPAPTCGTSPRHGIGVEQASGVTVTNCIFKDLTGDGVYIADYNASAICSSRVLVQANRFTGHHTSRAGVEVRCARDVRVQGNYFEGMGRSCMPGAINLEANTAAQSIEGVVVSGNEIVGSDGTDCALVNGINVSDGAGAVYDDIVVSNNTISGCFNTGISVDGVVNNGERPVVVTGNALAAIGKAGDGRKSAGIMVSTPHTPLAEPDPLNSCGANPRPASALVSDNSIRGVDDGYGIIVTDSDALINGNYVVGADRWGIVYSSQCLPEHHGEVMDNRIVDCGKVPGDGGGIQLRGSDSVIAGNHLFFDGAPNADPAIFVVNGKRNLISNNVVEGIQQGHRSILTAEAPQLLEHNRWSTKEVSGEAEISGDYDPTAMNGTALDGTGFWKRGTLLYNPNPQAGGPIGWVCTVSADTNEHSVWEPFGTIGSQQLATIDGAESLTNKTLTASSNVFPPFVTLDSSQVLANKDLTSPSNLFPPFATRDGIETLTHKNLTDPTNILPPTPYAMVLTVVENTGSVVAWTNMPSALTEIFGTTTRRMKVDLSVFKQFRIEAFQSVVGVQGATLRAQYATTLTNPIWTDLAATAGAGDVPVTTGSMPVINVGNLTSIAPFNGNADVYLRMVGVGGNGSADPSWYAIRIQLR